jgi:hypothetical protein
MYNYGPYYQGGAVPDMLSGYKQPYQMPVQTAPKQNDMIWVQGLEGAKGFPVAPNSTVVLWDSESSTIYVKTADGTGIPNMRILDFAERTGTSTPKNNEEYATKAQFEELTAKVNAITAKLEGEE